MTKNKLCQINIDKLEITYLLTHDIAEIINGKDEIIEYYDFRLEKDKDNKEYAVCYNIIIETLNGSNGYNETLFGKISYGTYNPYRNQLYIGIDNKMLYEDDLLIGAIQIIEQTLHLEFMALSKLDFALDVEKDIIKVFYNLIKRDDIIPIILNKKIKDKDEEINELLHMATGTRRTPYLHKSFYIDNKEGGLTLACYDKTKEIIDNGNKKDYIIKKDGFEKIYRLEIRTIRHTLKDTLNKLSISEEELYRRLFDKDFLMNIYFALLDRLIRINQGNKTYNLLQFLL